jgi:hypothetical protein
MYWHGPGSLSNKVQRTIIRPFSDPNTNLVMPLDLIASFDVPNAEKEDQILISQLVGGKTLTSSLVTPTSSFRDEERKEVSRTVEHVRQEIEKRKGEAEDFKAAFPPYVLGNPNPYSLLLFVLSY